MRETAETQNDRQHRENDDLRCQERSTGIGVFAFVVIVIWWVIDAFLIPGMIRNKNLLLAAELIAGGH